MLTKLSSFEIQRGIYSFNLPATAILGSFRILDPIVQQYILQKNYILYLVSRVFNISIQNLLLGGPLIILA